MHIYITIHACTQVQPDSQAQRLGYNPATGAVYQPDSQAQCLGYNPATGAVYNVIIIYMLSNLIILLFVIMHSTVGPLHYTITIAHACMQELVWS